MTGGMEFWLAVHSSNPRLATSALGQKRTSEDIQSMSALPPKADIGTHSRNVRFVPKADISLKETLIVRGPNGPGAVAARQPPCRSRGQVWSDEARAGHD
jgi:hypothetical protein